MAHATVDELGQSRLAVESTDERAEFAVTYAVTRLALDVGQKVRLACEAAGLTQGELATRAGASEAAVARMEVGGTSPTLTTLPEGSCRPRLRGHHRAGLCELTCA